MQSGQPERSATAALEQAGRRLDAEASGADAGSVVRDVPEIAFYGGTFTALAGDEFRACLDFTGNRLERGHISSARCSTRPDRLDAGRTAAMRAAGFSLVELGVQSFQDRALADARRGYSGAAALRACEAVRKAGFALGIQLMPGMPGLNGAGAERDVRLALDAAPACVRLYPCLVIEGTELADMWRSGLYTPWETEAATDFLAWALGEFNSAGIPVIRIGVAEDAGLAGRVLAGPRHPALGNRARASALYHYVRDRVLRLAPDAGRPGAPEYFLRVPGTLQGDFWGHKGELRDRYAALGLTGAHVRRWEEEHFALLTGNSLNRLSATRGARAPFLP
jgi:hypothetical protein